MFFGDGQNISYQFSLCLYERLHAITRVKHFYFRMGLERKDGPFLSATIHSVLLHFDAKMTFGQTQNYY